MESHEKELELVQKVEHHQLDLVGLTSMHSVDTGTKLLDTVWTQLFSGVALGLRRWAGVGILPSPWLHAASLQFTPVDKRVASLCLRSIGGGLLLLSLPMH